MLSVNILLSLSQVLKYTVFSSNPVEAGSSADTEDSVDKETSVDTEDSVDKETSAETEDEVSFVVETTDVSAETVDEDTSDDVAVVDLDAEQPESVSAAIITAAARIRLILFIMTPNALFVDILPPDIHL